MPEEARRPDAGDTNPARNGETRRPELFGMSEYLMFAHEIEKVRLLAREANKESHLREETSSQGSPPESRRSTRGAAASYPIEDGEFVDQTIHYATEDQRS